MPIYRRPFAILIISALLLGGCSQPAKQTTQAPATLPAASPSSPALGTGQANSNTPAENLPAAMEYNLADTTITQSRFPEDSRFHNMPVRLNGIIAVPDAEGEPHTNWAVAIATIVITIVTLIFAELVPKSLAVRYGERLALKYVKPLEIISVVLYPLVYILNHIGIRITRLVGEGEISKPTISEEEFHTAISIGEAEGVMKGDEAEMLHKVFEFTDSPVSKIMVPRTEIAWVEQGTKLKDFLELYARRRYSRFPVYRDNTDDVVVYCMPRMCS